MDSYRKIAISKIADILSEGKLIQPSIDIWKKIYYNAGLSTLYSNIESKLEIKIQSYGYNECDYYHNDNCYSALLETFTNIEDETELVYFFNSIVEKIPLNIVFLEDIQELLENDNYSIDFYSMFDISEYASHLSTVEMNRILKDYPSRIFELFLQNLQLIGFDVSFNKHNNLEVSPYSQKFRESTFDKSILMEWLTINYERVADSYTHAIRSYSNGDNVACISHCRNIITGFYSTQKAPQKKWMDGLKKICSSDKNIANVDTSKIHTYKYNANASDENARYQYPRYNLIYKLYSFSSALGAHSTEGNIKSNVVDCEIVNPEDAFLCLRMTEDMLIWIYQQKIDKDFFN